MNVRQIQKLIFLAECNKFARSKLGVDEPLFYGFMQAAERKIRESGPTRVLVSEDGEAVPPRRVELPDGVTVDRFAELVFIRADGWTLGAPLHLATVAVDLWRDTWVAVYDRRADAATPYIHGEVAEERLIAEANRSGVDSVRKLLPKFHRYVVNGWTSNGGAWGVSDVSLEAAAESFRKAARLRRGSADAKIAFERAMKLRFDSAIPFCPIAVTRDATDGEADVWVENDGVVYSIRCDRVDLND